MASPTHYEVIGLPPTASQAEIEHRYRELSRLYQLDSGSAGEGMGSLIAEAYRVLSNPTLRTVYDSTLPSTDSASGSSPAAPAPLPAPSPPALDRTQEVAPPPPAHMEKTVEVPRPAPAAEIEDRKLAAELSRRGISPDEVKRLVELGRESGSGSSRKSLAELAMPLVPPPPAFVPKPTISLPPQRQSTVQERAEADRLLTAANLARRRNNFKEAETLCRQAVELIPSDAAALELYGDILQATGRVDDAVIAYHRATEIDPNRRSAEKKYGDLVLRQDRSIALIQDDNIGGNRKVNVMLIGFVILLVVLFVGLMALRQFTAK